MVGRISGDGFDVYGRQLLTSFSADGGATLRHRLATWTVLARQYFVARQADSFGGDQILTRDPRHLTRAFIAENLAAISAVMFAAHHPELHPAIVAVGGHVVGDPTYQRAVIVAHAFPRFIRGCVRCRSR